jgi:hypothetical protein
MDPKELRGLLEAYTEVYQELDEVTGRGRIDPLSDYPNHGERGSRSPRDAGLKMSPYDRASARANALKKREDPEAKKRANRIKSRFIEPTKRGLGRAITASNVATAATKKRLMQGEEVDLYDIILSHLLDEGYAETLEAAEVMMVNMSEGWRQSIVEGRDVERGEEDSDAVRKHNKSLKDENGKPLYPSGRAGYAKRPNPANDPR